MYEEGKIKEKLNWLIRKRMESKESRKAGDAAKTEIAELKS